MSSSKKVKERVCPYCWGDGFARWHEGKWVFILKNKKCSNCKGKGVSDE